MAVSHPHGLPKRAVAATPTLSLLRWSAGQRLLAAALVLAPLWLAVLLSLG